MGRETQFLPARPKAPPPTWGEWASSFIWTPKRPNPRRATDASHDPALRAHFLTLLDNTEPPEVFKASEVAQLLTDDQLFKLGYENRAEALPAILELVFEFREFGYCDILQKGKVLGEDVTIMDVEGPIRIRRKQERVSGLTDDDW